MGPSPQNQSIPDQPGGLVQPSTGQITCWAVSKVGKPPSHSFWETCSPPPRPGGPILGGWRRIRLGSGCVRAGLPSFPSDPSPFPTRGSSLSSPTRWSLGLSLGRVEQGGGWVALGAGRPRRGGAGRLLGPVRPARPESPWAAPALRESRPPAPREGPRSRARRPGIGAARKWLRMAV